MQHPPAISSGLRPILSASDSCRNVRKEAGRGPGGIEQRVLGRREPRSEAARPAPGNRNAPKRGRGTREEPASSCPHRRRFRREAEAGSWRGRKVVRRAPRVEGIRRLRRIRIASVPDRDQKILRDGTPFACEGVITIRDILTGSPDIFHALPEQRGSRRSIP